MQRTIRVLRPDEVEGKTTDEIRAMIADGLLPPIAGGAPDDGGEGGESADPAKTGEEGDDGDPAKTGSGESGEGGEGEEWKPPTREEYEALAKSNAEAQKTIRATQKAQKEAERKAGEESGEHERLYQQEREANDKLRNNMIRSAAEQRVEVVAKRLNYIAPGVAHRLIDTAAIEGEVDENGTVSLAADAEAQIEQQLKALAASTDGLTKSGKQAPQANVEGDEGAGNSANRTMNDAIRSAAGRSV